MNEPGKKFATEMILQKNIDDYSWVFPHGHSSRFSIDIAKELGYDVEKFKWNTFPTIGNLASLHVFPSQLQGVWSQMRLEEGKGF